QERGGRHAAEERIGARGHAVDAARLVLRAAPLAPPGVQHVGAGGEPGGDVSCPHRAHGATPSRTAATTWRASRVVIGRPVIRRRARIASTYGGASGISPWCTKHGKNLSLAGRDGVHRPTLPGPARVPRPG